MPGIPAFTWKLKSCLVKERTEEWFLAIRKGGKGKERRFTQGGTGYTALHTEEGLQSPRVYHTFYRGYGVLSFSTQTINI